MRLGRLAEVRAVLSNRVFAVYTTCNSISMMGVWMQRLAVGWLTWQLTESEAWIGAIAFADLVPVVLVGPIAGVWVDRPFRRYMLKGCQSVMMLQTLALFYLTASGMINIWWLFWLVLLNGVTAAIYHPVRLSVVPSLVGSSHLMSAVSLTAVTFHLSRFAGPALGGVVIALYGVSATFLAVAACYSIMLIAVFLLKIPRRPWLKDFKKRSVFAEMLDGGLYTWNKRAIFYILLVQTILALCARPAGELLPAFVGSVFEMGPEMLALLTSAMGIGAVVAGLRMLLWDSGKGMVSLVLSSTVVSGLTVIAFSLAGNIWLAAVIIGLVAYWVTVSGIVSQTLIQTCVERGKRGRVVSLWAAIFRGGPGIGALIIGWLSGIYGLVWPNVIAAAICVVAASAMYRKRQFMSEFFVECPDEHEEKTG